MNDTCLLGDGCDHHEITTCLNTTSGEEKESWIRKVNAVSISIIENYRHIADVQQQLVEKLCLPNAHLEKNNSRSHYRLNPRGISFVRALLTEMGNIYAMNRVCGISPQTVMVHVDSWHVKLDSTYPQLTLNSFKEDAKGFKSLMELLCKDHVPDDLQCLIQYLEKQETWSNWLPAHPVTWTNGKFVEVFLMLKEMLSFKEAHRKYTELWITLSKVWNIIAKKRGDETVNADYWKKLVPSIEENEVIYSVFSYMKNEQTPKNFDSEVGYILFIRAVLVHYSDHNSRFLKNLGKEGKIQRKKYKTKPVLVEDLAEWIWMIQPDFMSLFMEILLDDPFVGQYWAGKLLGPIYINNPGGSKRRKLDPHGNE